MDATHIDFDEAFQIGNAGAADPVVERTITMSTDLEIRGLRPDARVGEEFHVRRQGSWSALTECIFELAPAEAGDLMLWGDCDSDVLGAEGGMRLADRSEDLLQDGSVFGDVAKRNVCLARHPSIECTQCDGCEIDPVTDQVCFRCQGTGTIQNPQTYRDLYESDVSEFCEFLRHAGGFSVWDSAEFFRSSQSIPALAAAQARRMR